jgi:hypothetical protein
MLVCAFNGPLQTLRGWGFQARIERQSDELEALQVEWHEGRDENTINWLMQRLFDRFI